MTWTYSGDPSNNNRDSVRFLIGDTDRNSQIVQDEEISFVLTQEPDIYQASALMCRAISAKYASKVDKSVGDLKISLSQRQRHYEDVAKRLEQRGVISSAIPYAGGISVTDKENQELNEDRVSPSFTKEMNDNNYMYDDERNEWES